ITSVSHRRAICSDTESTSALPVRWKMAKGLSHSEASPPCMSTCHLPQFASSSTTRWAITKLTVPLVLPGKMRFRFCPSIGLANVSAASQPGTLTMKMKPTAPRTFLGSRSRKQRTAASCATYSVPWTPAVMERRGPSSAPFTRPTGHRIGPPGRSATSSHPVTFVPGAARRLPNVSGCRIESSSGGARGRQLAERPLQPVHSFGDLLHAEAEAHAHVPLALRAELEARGDGHAAAPQQVLRQLERRYPEPAHVGEREVAALRGVAADPGDPVESVDQVVALPLQVGDVVLQ